MCADIFCDPQRKIYRYFDYTMRQCLLEFQHVELQIISNAT